MKQTSVRVLLAVLILHILSTVALAAEDKIGFVNAQRVLLSHPKYADAQKHLDAFIKEKADTASAAAEKEQDPVKRREIIDAARRASGDEELKVMNPLNADINNAIAKAAKDKGVTVVLNSFVIYFGGIDLTEDVVKTLKNQR